MLRYQLHFPDNILSQQIKITVKSLIFMDKYFLHQPIICLSVGCTNSFAGSGLYQEKFKHSQL